MKYLPVHANCQIKKELMCLDQLGEDYIAEEQQIVSCR